MPSGPPPLPTGVCPTSVDASADISVSNECSPGTHQCAGSHYVQTCGPNGQWEPTWSCVTGVCEGGGCSGSTTTAASCVTGDAGVAHCGTAAESCCTSTEVPGGTYYRWYDVTDAGASVLAADGGPTGESTPATVTGFRLDRYLVTVGRFREFVDAWSQGWRPSGGSGKHEHLNGGLGLTDDTCPGTYEPGWNDADDAYVLLNEHVDAGASYGASDWTWTPAPGDQEALPINGVNWYEAYAFCIWDGGFLPSQWEWEYAAAGGVQQREYPWGSADPGTANQYAIYGDGFQDECWFPGPGPQRCSLASIAPVGTADLGVGLWGQLDLAGDVAGWVMDYIDWSSVDGRSVPCTDCAKLAPSSVLPPPNTVTDHPYRWLRGASFYVPEPQDLTVPLARLGSDPTLGFDSNGIRCARPP
jgi:sulfatase modifying factor 1